MDQNLVEGESPALLAISEVDSFNASGVNKFLCCNESKPEWVPSVDFENSSLMHNPYASSTNVSDGPRPVNDQIICVSKYAMDRASVLAEQLFGLFQKVCYESKIMKGVDENEYNPKPKATVDDSIPSYYCPLNDNNSKNYVVQQSGSHETSHQSAPSLPTPQVQKPPIQSETAVKVLPADKALVRKKLSYYIKSDIAIPITNKEWGQLNVLKYRARNEMDLLARKIEQLQKKQREHLCDDADDPEVVDNNKLQDYLGLKVVNLVKRLSTIEKALKLAKHLSDAAQQPLEQSSTVEPNTKSQQSLQLDTQNQQVLERRSSNPQTLEHDAKILKLHEHEMRTAQLLENATRISQPLEQETETPQKLAHCSTISQPLEQRTRAPLQVEHGAKIPKVAKRNSCDSLETSSALGPNVPLKRCRFIDDKDQFCILCNAIFPVAIDLLNHLYKMHANVMEHLAPNNRPWAALCPEPMMVHDGDDSWLPIQGVEFLVPCPAFFCNLCKDFSGDINAARWHLESKKHNLAYKKFCHENSGYAEKMNENCRAYKNNMEKAKRRASDDSRLATQWKHPGNNHSIGIEVDKNRMADRNISGALLSRPKLVQTKDNPNILSDIMNMMSQNKASADSLTHSTNAKAGEIAKNVLESASSAINKNATNSHHKKKGNMKETAQDEQTRPVTNSDVATKNNGKCSKKLESPLPPVLARPFTETYCKKTLRDGEGLLSLPPDGSKDEQNVLPEVVATNSVNDLIVNYHSEDSEDLVVVYDNLRKLVPRVDSEESIAVKYLKEEMCDDNSMEHNTFTNEVQPNFDCFNDGELTLIKSEIERDEAVKLKMPCNEGMEDNIAINQETKVPTDCCFGTDSEGQYTDTVQSSEGCAGNRPLEEENCSGVVQKIVVCDQGDEQISINVLVYDNSRNSPKSHYVYE